MTSRPAVPTSVSGSGVPTTWFRASFLCPGHQGSRATLKALAVRTIVPSSFRAVQVAFLAVVRSSVPFPREERRGSGAQRERDVVEEHAELRVDEPVPVNGDRLAPVADAVAPDDRRPRRDADL